MLLISKIKISNNHCKKPSVLWLKHKNHSSRVQKRRWRLMSCVHWLIPLAALYRIVLKRWRVKAQRYFWRICGLMRWSAFWWWVIHRLTSVKSLRNGASGICRNSRSTTNVCSVSCHHKRRKRSENLMLNNNLKVCRISITLKHCSFIDWPWSIKEGEEHRTAKSTSER